MGRETDALAFLTALATAPYRYDFYQTLRRLECLYATSRAGARRCARSTSRFASARIRTCRSRRRRWPRSSRAPAASHRGCRCGCSACSVPNGPLPIHFTEYARERLRMPDDPTLSRFLDLFHHRFLALFYRAWAQAQPHVNRDRPDDDRFTVYIGSFIGMSPPALRGRDACRIVAKFFTPAR